jgi:osmotically-inducible protein OsmY
MAELERRTLLLAGIALLAPACASKSTGERAALDQEIARDILWRYKQDSAGRFRDVQILCEDRVVTLEGRVSNAKDAADAIQIAMSMCRGGKIDSRIEVRLR